MLLNFNLSFEKDIAHDDICRTVIEVVEEVNIAKYVDFTNRNAHGYDGVMMFKLIMLAMADSGYVSTRPISDICLSLKIRSHLIRHFKDLFMMI